MFNSRKTIVLSNINLFLTYSNYINLGDYMLAKTLVVYSMGSLLTYIHCVFACFFFEVASASICQIK